MKGIDSECAGTGFLPREIERADESILAGLVLTAFGGMQWFSTWSVRGGQLWHAPVEVELRDKRVVVGIRGAAVFGGLARRRWRIEQPDDRARYVKVGVKGMTEACKLEE